MPVKVSDSPSVNVSPMLIVPWLCRPMMSPAKASSACCRSAAMNVSASAIRTSLPSRTWSQPHAALVAAGADAQERDAIAVRGIHVRLDLEHEAGERRLVRARPSRVGRAARPRRRRVLDERGQQFLDAEVADRGAEESPVSAARRGTRPASNCGVAPAHQLDLLAERALRRSPSSSHGLGARETLDDAVLRRHGPSRPPA